MLHEGGSGVRIGDQHAVLYHHPHGRHLHESPPPSIGPTSARELVKGLEDAGILITGK